MAMAMSMAMASVVPALRCLSRNTETDRVANTTVPQSKSKNSSLPFLQKTWEYDPYSSSSSSSSSSSDESSDSVLLQQWLTSQKLPPQKLSLQKVEAESGGRGLVATSNIRKGERLLFVPSSLIITTDSEWSNQQSATILSSENVPEWPFLATFLISEASHGTNSHWYPYIYALPRQPESILLWSATEINKYLSVSSVANQALERIAEVEKIYNDMHTSIYSKHPQLFPEEFFTMESFKWAFGILFSRLVRLQSLNQKVALVPWADMLNHSSQVEAYLDYEKTSDTVILTTDRPYQPSEQVFISYGEKSKGEILLSYGFVSSDVNEIDSMELSFALKDADEMLIEKEKALKEHGLSSPCRYPVTIMGIPSQLFAFAYLAACPASMSPRFGELAAAAASKVAPGFLDRFQPSIYDIPRDVDIEAHELILKAVEASLSKITKFLEVNQASNGAFNLKEGKQSSMQNSKLKMACALCASEQRILHRVQYVLRTKLRELRAKKSYQGTSSDSKSNFLYGLRKLFK